MPDDEPIGQLRDYKFTYVSKSLLVPLGLIISFGGLLVALASAKGVPEDLRQFAGWTAFAVALLGLLLFLVAFLVALAENRNRAYRFSKEEIQLLKRGAKVLHWVCIIKPAALTNPYKTQVGSELLPVTELSREDAERFLELVEKVSANPF